MSCTHDCGCSAETRDARTDDWGHTSPLSPQNADLREFQPADASEALRDVPPAERPSEALPRPIDPEDVRVGMVVDIIDRARIRRVDDQRAWISDDEYTMLRRDGRSLCTVASTPRTFDKATNEWKDGETLFMRGSIWREAAENVAESLTRGTRVIVTGRLKSRSYEKDGQQRTAYELDVDEIGPSLRYARANVRKSDRSAPQSSSPQPQGDPWRFTRFVADDHECVIVRDEYDEPAPFGSCSTHRRALSSPVALGCTTSARVGAAVALDLDALHETICDNFTGMAEVQQAADLLVAEVRRLAALCIPLTDLAQELDLSRQNLHHSRAMSSAHFERAEREKARAESAEAEVVTLRARLAEAEALADQWADRKRSDGMSGNAWIGLTLSGVAADLRAALATTGEGQ